MRIIHCQELKNSYEAVFFLMMNHNVKHLKILYGKTKHTNNKLEKRRDSVCMIQMYIFQKNMVIRKK